MSVLDSSEFFINMKRIPTKDSAEYEAFFEQERHKMDYGVTINGVYIHGWLYTHLNHWHIYLDREDEISGRPKRAFVNPDCRDNEWIIAESLKQAEDDKKGLMIFGSRRLGKSEFLSSYVGRSAILYQGSENLITGGNWPDIDVITGKLDKGLSAMHPYFKWARFGDNWRKDISLGFKKKRGSERVEWSIIRMRNYDNGTNTEAAAGPTPSTYVIDEIGKFPWLECFKAAVPSFTTPFGWRVVPIATGTSGDLKANTDAEKVFRNPESENFLAVELKDEKKKTAVFIPGTRRMEAKFETTLGTFIENDKGILLPADSELFKVKFWDSDLELGNKIIEDEIAQAMLSPDTTSALKVRMYYPRNTQDLFLSEEDNKFPIEAIKEWLAFLENNKDNETIVGTPVRLFRGVDGKVSYSKDIETKEITDFPVTGNTLKDAPIIIYEFPINNPPYLLYISGVDPYNQNESLQSPSLGTCHIYKRMYDAVSGTFQKSIVASLASRPKTMKEWHETVELLLEFYNATCMPENEGGTFVQYFDSKNKSHVIADGYSLNKEINPSSGIQGRAKGLPATVPIINYCMRLLYDYCSEKVVTGVNPETKEPITKLGIIRIRDKMLLTEMLNYRKGINVDRIVSFRHVLAYDAHLEKYFSVIKVDEADPDPRPKPPPMRSPFALTGMRPFLMPKKR